MITPPPLIIRGKILVFDLFEEPELEDDVNTQVIEEFALQLT